MYTKHGMSYSPEYHVYAVAKDRCTNPNSQRWYTHGGRGIEFRFTNFGEFYAELGPRPSTDYSLDRIDNNGHYEKGNVKWATRSEQQKNKRSFTHKVRHGRGYHWHKGARKWTALIKYRGTCTYLGLFVEEADAKAAYDAALAKVREQEANVAH